MSQVAPLDANNVDLENGAANAPAAPAGANAATAAPDLQNNIVGTQVNLAAPRPVIHTDEELLKRASEINKSGDFIFPCYSELNTFLLLRAQAHILKLENKLRDCVKDNVPWTDADSIELQEKLNQYRIIH